MAIQGVPKFDAIQLMEISAIDFRQGQEPRLEAKGAFVNITNGHTFGQTTCRHFSKATRDKLQELRAAMEQDLADLVFEATHTGQALTEREQFGNEPLGLGEHLASATDAESV